MRPTGPKIEAEGRGGGSVFGEGQLAPFAPAMGVWERYNPNFMSVSQTVAEIW